jgi:hypothetical protein
MARYLAIMITAHDDLARGIGGLDNQRSCSVNWTSIVNGSNEHLSSPAIGLLSTWEIAMLVRATVSSLTVAVAVLACGCSSESPYNTSTDPAKDAADIGPAPKVTLNRKKITKPPGGPVLKSSKKTQYVD